MNGRAVGRVDGAVIAGAVDAAAGLFGRQPVAIVGEAPLGISLNLPLQARGGERRVGDIEGAALGVVAVDVLRLADPSHFVHGRHHGAQQAPSGFALVGVVEQFVHSGRGAHAPAAVAPAGAEADGHRLHNGDVQVRLEVLQVVGGPQTGKAPADDEHIGLRRQVARRFGFRNPVERIEPETYPFKAAARHRVRCLCRSRAFAARFQRSRGSPTARFGHRKSMRVRWISQRPFTL